MQFHVDAIYQLTVTSCLGPGYRAGTQVPSYAGDAHNSRGPAWGAFVACHLITELTSHCRQMYLLIMKNGLSLPITS
jgi:hypothetical protein